MKQTTSVKTKLTWESRFGLSEATIIDGKLTDLRIFLQGADMGGERLWVHHHNLPFLRHIQQCLADLLEVLGEEDEK